MLLSWCILHAVSGIAIIIIFMYHVYRLVFTSRKDRCGVPVIMNMVAIIFFFIHSAYDAGSNVIFYTEAFPLSDDWCRDYTYWRLVAFELGKFSLYLVWITQIYISYKTSSYHYSVKLIILPLYMMDVTFLFLFTCFLNFHVFEAHHHGISCSMQWNWGIVAIFVFFDAFFNITTFVLFVRPLALIIKHGAENHSSHAQTGKFVRVIVKKIILISIAIISTALFVPIELLFGIPLVPIDDVVNSVCILLILSLHRELYSKCCGKMETKLIDYWYHNRVMPVERVGSSSETVDTPSPTAVASPTVDTSTVVV